MKQCNLNHCGITSQTRSYKGKFSYILYTFLARYVDGFEKKKWQKNPTRALCATKFLKDKQ